MWTLCLFILPIFGNTLAVEEDKRNLMIYYDEEWKPVPLLSDGTNLKSDHLRFGPLPCSCQNSTCGCCLNMNINAFNFSRTGCMNFSYVPEDFAIQMDVLMNDENVYTNSISGKNPPPVCIPFPYLPMVEFCVKVFDIYTEGRNIHMCMDFETRIVAEPILVLQFDCFQMGTGGLSHLKPTESTIRLQDANNVSISI